MERKQYDECLRDIDSTSGRNMDTFSGECRAAPVRSVVELGVGDGRQLLSLVCLSGSEIARHGSFVKSYVGVDVSLHIVESTQNLFGTHSTGNSIDADVLVGIPPSTQPLAQRPALRVRGSRCRTALARAVDQIRICHDLMVYAEPLIFFCLPACDRRLI